MFFDEQFNVVKTGYSRVGNANTVKDHFSELQKLPVQKNGYLYVYVSNESPVAVFFDNLQVVHTRGPILEENHYYPFGLTMTGISSKAASFGGAENKIRFNGIEQNTDFDINMYDAYYRNLDPQTGRFWQQDPRPGMSISNYAAMQNNPVFYADPFGDTIINGQKYEPTSFANATYLAGVTVTPNSARNAELADYLSRVGTEIESIKCHIDGQKEALKEYERMLDVYSKLDYAHGQVMPPLTSNLVLFINFFEKRTYGNYYVETNGYLGARIPITGVAPGVGIAGEVGGLNALTEISELDGSFSITEFGWQNYPKGIPRPQGPFRLVEGSEYAAARTAANNANKALSNELGLSGKFVDIHEITPVKFNGSPTNINNKMFLDRTFHQLEVTPFWNNIMRGIK